MKKLIIAEKPSIAKTLATHLGINKKEDGYFENNQYIVSWTYGHLVQLKPAKSYVDENASVWSLKSIPIIPEEFQLEVKNETYIKKQYKIISQLVKQVDCIINATDPAREGELIFRYLISSLKIENNKSFKRLWLSSYTSKEMDLAFNSIKDQSEYDGLYYSGKARNEADWIYGINGTIALTKILDSQNGPLSLGRVQTPTFAMVTNRFLENKNFKPEDFFYPEIKLKHTNIEFTARGVKNCKKKEEADTIISKLENSIKCVEASKRSVTEKQPLLYDLTELQKKANQKFGYTAGETLEITQALYEKHKSVTYPRTDSRYITKAMKNEVPNLLKLLGENNIHNDFVSKINTSNLPDVCVNDAKVTDHHAIIPTELLPDLETITEKEKNIYNLIVTRFISSFMEQAKKDVTVYYFGEEKLFKSSGTVYTNLGWKSLETSKKDSKEILPNINEGEHIDILEKYTKKSKTTPPSLLTDASLIGLMDNCGKDFDTDDKDVKSSGIGTVATRHSIIERIIKVNYIKRDGKYLIPTNKGLKLYKLICNMNIASPSLTGEWEDKLSLIAKGNFSYNEFSSLIKSTLQNNLLSDIYTLKGKTFDEKKECPVCNQKTLTAGRKYTCSSCNLSIWNSFFGKKINYETLVKLASHPGETILIKGLESPGNHKKFEANVYFDKDEKKLMIKKNESKVSDNICLSCGGKMVNRVLFYGCENYSNQQAKCNFTIPIKYFGVTIQEKDIDLLFNKKETSLIKGFVSKGKKFEAKLYLDDKLKVKFKFK